MSAVSHSYGSGSIGRHGGGGGSGSPGGGGKGPPGGRGSKQPLTPARPKKTPAVQLVLEASKSSFSHWARFS
jgi:hypothetical protein